MKNSIRITLPHDPVVRNVPFSKLPLSSHFEKIYNSLQSHKILGQITQSKTWPDIPQFFIYSCERFSNGKKVNMAHGYGGGDDERNSIERAISEAIEHYCILNETPEKFVHGSYTQLAKRAIDPTIFVPFTERQLAAQKYKKFNISNNSSINWLTGQDLTNHKEVLIPASLAYANYSNKQHDEPVIRMPISTGAACGPNINFAICKGLCEIIERDGYVISFLPEMPKRLISIEKSNKELKGFVEKFTRYNFEIYFFDTTLDTEIFSVVCLLVDRTGVGPAVCCGLGAGLDTTNVLKTSAIEAYRRYVSNRKRYFQTNGTPPKKGTFEWFNWYKHREWSAPHMIRQVENFIKSSKQVSLAKTTTFKTDKEYLKYTLSKLKNIGCTAYYIDMTTPEIGKVGLKVAKVLVPEMVPLWHDERYPYFGIKRLLEVPKKMNIDVNLNMNVNGLLKIHPF